MRRFRLLPLFALLAAWSVRSTQADEPVELPHLLPEAATAGQPAAEILEIFHKYLHELDEIERQAATAKAAACQKLLERLRASQTGTDKTPGLIGTGTVAEEPAGVAFHYQHGRLFPAELIRGRFHGDYPLPAVRITLAGYVDVPRDMTVKIWHAAGGVNEDWGELYLGERKLGQVGDDMAKAAIYVTKLPQGRHPLRWVLSGGLFQHSLLRIEDAQTGELLEVHHNAAQRRSTGADQARHTIVADVDPSTWPKMADPHEWSWQPLSE
jgi:hypothetical protein